MTRWLYLARHGDAQEGHGLTATGRKQAQLLADRMSTVPLTSLVHSPEQRAVETAAAFSPRPSDPAKVQEAATLTAESWAAAGDYVPYLPDPLPPTDTHFFDGCTEEELKNGARWAAEAQTRFATPSTMDRHDLVITHAFLIAWFVRDALGAPPERWLGINAANCSLTVIRYAEDRPPVLVQFNDLSHLRSELRWTGFSQSAVPA